MNHDVTKVGDIILFPAFQKLKEDVERMRTELTDLLSMRDDLQFVVCKNIEAKYYLILGALEYKTFKAQCEALRLRRKLELI